MNQSDIKNRLKAIISEKGHTVNSFSKETGLSQRTLSRQINEGTSVGYDVISIIAKKYPDISLNWLITGEGSMIKDSNMLRIHNPPYSEAINENVVVPLYDIEAAANLTMTMNNEKENVIAYISLPSMPAVDGAVAVRGDSMYPIIKSGDIVVFKWVSSPEYITYGEMYLVSYMWDDDKHVTVKYVKRSRQPGYISLVSYNSHYDPIDIPISCIQSIAIVKVSIRYNTIS